MKNVKENTEENLTFDEREAMEKQIIEIIKTCFDPEIPVNIYDLGLIYNIDVSIKGNVTIMMTLTSPNCPAVETLPEEVKQKVSGIYKVNKVDIRLVWDPPYSQEMMSEEAKLTLGFF